MHNEIVWHHIPYLAVIHAASVMQFERTFENHVLLVHRITDNDSGTLGPEHQKNQDLILYQIYCDCFFSDALAMVDATASTNGNDVAPVCAYITRATLYANFIDASGFFINTKCIIPPH